MGNRNPENDEQRDRSSRRTFLGSLGALGGISAFPLISNTVRAETRSRSVSVSRGLARKAAARKVESVSGRDDFRSWSGSSLGRPTPFSFDLSNGGYSPAAYVFPVRTRGDTEGYVTVAARRDWPPILEYSTAAPPQETRAQTRNQALERGSEATGRLLYHGGVKYGLEATDGVVHNLRNQRPERRGAGVDPSQVEATSGRTVEQWNEVDSTGKSSKRTGNGTTTQSTVTASSSWGRVWGVPCWTESDDGDANQTHFGDGPDTWDEWDGCVPVAGSMIIAYHEGISENNVDERERIIDFLHEQMGTTDGGSTDPWRIDDGFDGFNLYQTDFNGANMYVWTHPNFTKSEIDNHDRPFLLNMTSGDSAEDGTGPYGDHTVTIVGYRDGGDEWRIHDTWGDDAHYLAHGSYLACSYTKVTTS